MAGARLGVRVLGPVAVDVDDRQVALPGARQQALFLRLLVADGAPVGPWQLRHDVWDGRHKSDAALRVAVSRLRAALAAAGAPDVVDRTSDGYRMDRRDVDIDADRFTDLVTKAHRFACDDPAVAADLATDALAMWRGSAFGDLGGESFLVAEAEHLTGLWRDAVELRLSALLALGTEGLVPELEAAVADAPLRERRTALLMLALYRGGRQAEALAAYRRLETALRDDLGLSPSGELRRIQLRILKHDPALLESSRHVPRAAPAPGNERDAALGALGRARSARALARAGAVDESLRVSAAAVEAARSLDELTLAQCLVAAAQTSALGGRAAEAVAALDEAVVLARRHGDGSVLATAAVVRFGFGLSEGDDVLAMLTEPLELLPLDAARRVDLLCAAMHEVALRRSCTGALRLLEQAEATAALVGDPRSKALVLAGRAILAGVRGDGPGAVGDLADEALAAAEASDDPTLVVAALHGLFRATLERGDVAALERAASRLSQVATASLFPFAVVRLGLLDVSMRLARGQFDGLEDRLAEVEATGQAVGVVSSAGTTRTQRALLAIERAQFDAIAGVASSLSAENAAWQAVLALALAETGQLTEAVSVAGGLVGPGTLGAGELTQDERNVAAILAAEVAVLAADPALASRARARLDGLRGRFAVVAHATITLGPVDRLLGLLALLEGDVEAAVADLRSAVALASQAPLWHARSQLGLATALRARCSPGDAEEADRLFDGVRSSAVADPAQGGSAWLSTQLQRAEQFADH